MSIVGADTGRDSQAWILRDRQWRMSIRYTKDGIEYSRTIGEPEESSGLPLRIGFQVDRTDGTALNTASIRLWNLSRETADMLMIEGVQIDLRAGYGETIPMIFSGTVVQLTEQLSGANRLFTIEAVDGFQILRNAYISASFKRNTSCYTVLEYIAKTVGIPIVYAAFAESELKELFLPPIALHGTASSVLTDLLNGTIYQWRISLGILHIYRLQVSSVEEAYVLTPLTGLIGLPERLFESSVTYTGSETTDMAYYMYGYRVNFFLNGALEVGDTVYLESSIATGIFSIYKMTIKGDNLSGDWQCTAELREYSGGES